MFESLASCFAFSLQRFAQFATGQIRRGGHDNGVCDSKIAFSNQVQKQFFLRQQLAFRVRLNIRGTSLSHICLGTFICICVL
jgi:hypothetical protein